MPKTRGKSTAARGIVPPVNGAETLHSLSDEFDGLLDRLQTPAARRALKFAFAATPKTLGRLAVASKKSM